MSQLKKASHPTHAEFALALSSWEGQFLEFKEAISDSLARELVAFANAEGGRIYIGVADDKKVKGIAVTNRLLSQAQDLARHCEPPVEIHAAAFKYEERDLLMIDVPEGNHKPYGCSAGYFLRSGPNCQKLNRNELVEFVRAIEPVIAERQDCPAFRHPEDFSAEAFQAFLRMSGASSGGLSTEDLLVNMGCARLDGPRLILNNASVLFFAKNPVRLLPQARVACVLFQTPERLHILDRKDLEGGLLDNLQQAEVFLLRHLPVRYEIRGLDRVEHPEFPVAALREGLVNAFAHRDYSVRGGNISIEIFPDRAAIVSPGGLPPGLAPEDFGRRSLHRNPLIADLLFRAQKVERSGTGIGRMRALLAQSNCLEPAFHFTSFFELLLARRPASGGKSGPSGGQAEGQATREVAVLQYVREHGSITRRQFVGLTGKSGETARRELGALVQAGRLARVGQGRSVKYVAGIKELAD